MCNFSQGLWEFELVDIKLKDILVFTIIVNVGRHGKDINSVWTSLERFPNGNIKQRSNVVMWMCKANEGHEPTTGSKQ